MSKLPVGQVRLTNIAVVRMKIKGKRFEIACFKNKVLNWRNKIERDLDETLQSRQIFTNVSKAIIAKTEDLIECFGTADHDQICIQILEKGEAQVSEKERQVEHDSKLKDIATIVADKTINRDTNRPFPVSMIESSMKTIHFSVHPTRSAKQQALELIRSLKTVLHIERAQMRVRLEAPLGVAKQLKAKVTTMETTTVEHEQYGSSYELVLLLDPGSYRELEEHFKQLTKGKGNFEIIDMKVSAEGDVKLEEEAAARESNESSDPIDSATSSLSSMRIIEPSADTSIRATAIAKSQALKPMKKSDSDEEHDTRRKNKKNKGKKGKQESDDEEEDGKSTQQQQQRPKKERAKPMAVKSESSDSEVEVMGMAKKRSVMKKQMKKNNKKSISESESEEETPQPKPKSKPAPKKPAKKQSSSESESESESDDDEPAKPSSKPKSEPAVKVTPAKPTNKQISSSDEASSSEDEAPKKKVAPKKKPVKKKESSDDSES